MIIRMVKLVTGTANARKSAHEMTHRCIIIASWWTRMIAYAFCRAMWKMFLSDKTSSLSV